MRTVKRIGNLYIERGGDNVSFMIVDGYKALETTITMQGVYELIQALRAEFQDYMKSKPCLFCKNRTVCRECSTKHEKFEPALEM